MCMKLGSFMSQLAKKCTNMRDTRTKLLFC